MLFDFNLSNPFSFFLLKLSFFFFFGNCNCDGLCFFICVAQELLGIKEFELILNGYGKKIIFFEV